MFLNRIDASFLCIDVIVFLSWVWCVLWWIFVDMIVMMFVCIWYVFFCFYLYWKVYVLLVRVCRRRSSFLNYWFCIVRIILLFFYGICGLILCLLFLLCVIFDWCVYFLLFWNLDYRAYRKTSSLSRCKILRRRRVLSLIMCLCVEVMCVCEILFFFCWCMVNYICFWKSIYGVWEVVCACIRKGKLFFCEFWYTF